jgi:hypothetical protein
MARPRKPTVELELKGAFKKDPQRRRSRENEPKPSGVLGDPPEEFRPEEKSIWLELASIAPPKVLTNTDRWIVEMAVKIMSRLRKEGIGGRYGVQVGELAQLKACLSAMGMTPVDRSKVIVTNDPNDQKQQDPFAELAGQSPTKSVQ